DGPGRWAHAIFHANAPVRRLALAQSPTGTLPLLALALLSDPATEELVHAQLPELVKNGSVLPYVLSFVRAGRLPPDALLQCLLADWVRDKPQLLLTPLPVSFGFPSARMEFEQFQSVRDAFTGHDALDDLCLFLWEHDPADRFFDVLAHGFSHERLDMDLERRIAWSLARIGRDRPKHWTASRLAPLAAVMPIALADPDIALEVRQDAARLLPRVGGKSRLENPLNGIATGPVLRGAGGLDLPAVVGVASRCNAMPFDLVHSYYGKELEGAIHRDPEGAVELLKLPHSAKAAEAYRSLLHRFLSVDHPADRMARLALSLGREQLALMAARSPNTIVRVTSALLQRERDGLLELSDSKRR
ncbi:MAG: hypothetical protein AAFY60_20890, partial [Myxococcota bacterium]